MPPGPVQGHAHGAAVWGRIIVRPSAAAAPPLVPVRLARRALPRGPGRPDLRGDVPGRPPLRAAEARDEILARARPASAAAALAESRAPRARDERGPRDGARRGLRGGLRLFEDAAALRGVAHGVHDGRAALPRVHALRVRGRPRVDEPEGRRLAEPGRARGPLDVLPEPAPTGSSLGVQPAREPLPRWAVAPHAGAAPLRGAPRRSAPATDRDARRPAPLRRLLPVRAAARGRRGGALLCVNQ